MFNADDPLVLLRVDKTKGQTVFFSKDLENSTLKTNLEKGYFNITLINDDLVIQEKELIQKVAHIQEIPITFNGKAKFNIENVMAAIAATSALGLTIEQIRKGLLSFIPTIEQLPGRMNVIDVGAFKVLVDYGHNIGAIDATSHFIKELMPGRIIRMAHGTGNRRSQDIFEFGFMLAKHSDNIILCDADPRERASGETANILKKGLLKGGFTQEMVTVVFDESQATEISLKMARPGDVVVLQVQNISQVIQDVLDFKAKVEAEE